MTTTQTATIIDRSAATERARIDSRNASSAVSAAIEAGNLFVTRTGWQSERLNAALREASLAREAAYRAYREALALEFDDLTR